jgi:hypothetical protein
MIQNSRATIWEKELTLAMKAQAPYKAHSTAMLNAKEKFRVYPGIVEVPGGYPAQFKYFAIGVGGEELLTDNSGYSYNIHKPIDAALFEHVPFVMRTVDNDIPDNEKVNYRFRIKEVYNGVEYICYYLKVIPYVNIPSNIFKITTSQIDNMGTGELSYFDVNVDTFLNPIPTKRTLDPLDNTNATYVCKVAKISLDFSAQELIELKNVLSTIYPNTNKHITELAVCSGHDIVEDGKYEASVVQIMHHITIEPEVAMSLNTDVEFSRTFEIGGIEPLLI